MQQNDLTPAQDIQQMEMKYLIKKKITVILLSIAVIAALVFALTLTRYTSPQTRGLTEMEPGMVNTVLLGQLTGEQENILKNPANQVKNAGNQIIGTSIRENLDLNHYTGSTVKTWTHEFGESAQVQNQLTAKRPGDTITIPFLITNGTTVSTNTVSYNQIENVSDISIQYKLSVITTLNLPLTYELKDLDSDIIYQLSDPDPVPDELVGGDVKKRSVVSANRNFDENSCRILYKQEDGTISAHRYALIVKWKNETAEDKSVEYMKEIENIEIRLEIMSFARDLSGDLQVDTIADGIITLSAANTDAVEHLYPVDSDIHLLYGNKTVRYSNFGPAAVSADALPTELASEAGKVYGYDFSVYNCDQYTSEWQDAAGEDADVKGQYVVSGDFGGYSGCKLAIAVPDGTQEKAYQKDRSLASDYDYYLSYNGKLYRGVLSGNDADEGSTNVVRAVRDRFTTTLTRVKKVISREEENSGLADTTSYEDMDINAYRMVTFVSMDDAENKESAEPAELTELTLEDFTEDKLSVQEFTLYMVDKNNHYSYNTVGKNDFRIYIYQ